MLRAIEVRSEPRAVFRECASFGQAEHLITTTVGEDRLGPPNETMETTATGDQVIAWAQVQVVRVAQKNLGARQLEVPVRDALDSAPCSDGHERRRLYVAVRR